MQDLSKLLFEIQKEFVSNLNGLIKSFSAEIQMEFAWIIDYLFCESFAEVIY
jgi:hypothetical protein